MMTSRGARITTIVPLILLALLLYDAATKPAVWDAARATGFVLALIFLTLLTVARIQLGDNFSVAPEARTLVTTGLYSKVRNPVYVFGILGIFGMLLYAHLYPAMLIFAVILPLQFVRARAEARVLEAKFGDEYRAYRDKTWF
jgi:protein-S-isoprenylcysteine O-methyltransferase Ste14